MYGRPLLGSCAAFLLALSVAGSAASQQQPIRTNIAEEAAAEEEAPGADTGEKKEEKVSAPGFGIDTEGSRLKWRGTAFKWSQALTTTAVGVGQDIQSEAGEVYSQGFWVLLNYYLVESDSAQLRIASSPGFDVELTNSNVTTDLREPQFRDLNLSAILAVPLWEDAAKQYSITAVGNGTLLFPTSEISSSTGTYLTTSPRAVLGIGGPLLRGADFPRNFQIAGSVRWDHRFGEATEPTSEDVRKLNRRSVDGEALNAANLTGEPFAHDVISTGGYIYLEGELFGRPLEMFASASWATQFLYDFDDTTCVVVQGACSPVEASDDSARTRVTTSFAVEAYYWPMNEWGFSLGYQSLGNQLAPDGQRRSPLYNPSAAFTTQVILSLDALYEAATGTRRKNHFWLSG